MNRATTMLSYELDIRRAAVPEHLLHTADMYLLVCAVVFRVWNGCGPCVVLCDYILTWPVFNGKNDHTCVDQRVKAARGLWWITVDKQIYAKIGLVQTDHSKYCQTCLALALEVEYTRQTMEWHTHTILPCWRTHLQYMFYVVMTLIAYSGN